MSMIMSYCVKHNQHANAMGSPPRKILQNRYSEIVES